MKLATLPNDTADGALVVVSRDLNRAVTGKTIAPSLRAAIDDWTSASGPLQALSDDLNAGRSKGDFAFAPKIARAPLPRAWQWLDGSVFEAHLDLATKAYGLPNP